MRCILSTTEARSISSFNHYSRIGATSYQTVLDSLHDNLAPKTYLEVGSKEGRSLRHAKCISLAVDPKFMLSKEVVSNKPAMFFFQTTSDKFFAKYDPCIYLQGRIDFAFLDGMHLCEFLLRDFMNTEKYCSESSVIALHDCLPGERIAAFRDPKNAYRQSAINPRIWTGDVWKVIPMLAKYRPDLRISICDAAPTGLAFITGFKTGDTALTDNYDKIVAEMEKLETDEALEGFWDTVEILPAEQMLSLDSATRVLWGGERPTATKSN